MADFCNICTQKLVSAYSHSTDIEAIVIPPRLLNEGDINIKKLFDKHIKTNMEDFLSDEFYMLNINGICEHCGLTRLTLKKEDNIVYLVAWCLKDSKENNTGKYRIAIVTENKELEYQEDELTKYYEEI